MFRADIKRLNEAVAEISGQTKKLNWLLEETENVALELGRDSEMLSVRYSLQKEVEQMRNELRIMTQMVATLGLAERYYSSCENSIIDYAEGNMRKQKRLMEWYSVQVDETAKELLDAFIF